MTPRTISLRTIDHARIASPCPMRWEDLETTGAAGDTVRHCHACSMNVYNFSNMSEEEVEGVLRSTGDRLCAGFYRRADGTLMTRDCPVGLRAVRARTARLVGRIAAVIGLVMTGGVLFGRAHDRADTRLRYARPFSDLCERISPTAAPTRGFVLGDVCVPTAAAPAQTGGGSSGAPPAAGTVN